MGQRRKNLQKFRNKMKPSFQSVNKLFNVIKKDKINNKFNKFAFIVELFFCIIVFNTLNKFEK